MQGLRAHVLGEERLPARELEARPLRVDGVRGVHGRRAALARERRPLRRVALHLVVHAHARLRGDAPPAPARTGGHVPRRWHPGQGQSVGEPQELEARARARAPPQRAGRPPGGAGARQGADRRGMRRQRVRRLLLRCHRPRLGGCGRPRLGPCREDTRRVHGGERRPPLLRLRRIFLEARRRGSEGSVDREHQHGQRAPFEARGVPRALPRGRHQAPAALPGLVLLRRAVQARGHGPQGAALRARGRGDVLDDEAHDPSRGRKPHGVLDQAVSPMVV